MRVPSALTLILHALRATQHSSLLLQVSLWYVFVPSFLGNVLQRLVGGEAVTPYGPAAILNEEQLPWALAVTIGLQLCMLFGTTCLLLAALRKPTRGNRWNFTTLQREAMRAFFPVLGTDILRTTGTLLFGLLLIIPGVVFAVQTVCATCVTVAEGRLGREALRQSRALVRGQSWEIGFLLLSLAGWLFIPGMLFSEGVELLVQQIDTRLLAISDATRALANAAIGVIGTLVIASLYRSLRAGWPTAEPDAD